MIIRLDLHEVALRLEVGDDLLARLIAVEALIFAAVSLTTPLSSRTRMTSRLWRRPTSKSFGSCRRHLDAAGAEVHFGIVVRDDGDLLPTSGRMTFLPTMSL